MRYRTVQNRLRLSCLPKEIIQQVYVEMKGISDESTKSGKGQQLWVSTLHEAFKKDKERIMDTYYDVQDTLDEFITKLEKMRKKVGGDTHIQTSKPRTLLIPFERDELFKGIQLIEKDGCIVIRG